MPHILSTQLACLLLVLSVYLPAYAINIAIDHPQRCGSLQCFPAADNPDEYYYLPSNPHLSVRKDGTPEFSFMRYIEAEAAAGGDGGITEAGGGGVIHFLVDYSVTKGQLKSAEQSLQEVNQNAVLRGSIPYEEGRFALVSSVVSDQEGASGLTHQVIGSGRAPLIEGHKVAVSMHLTKRGAQLLWHSFQMATPDVSLVFEMKFSGLTDPVEATITADWSKLREQADKNQALKVGYANIALGFDYKSFWDKAHQSGAISIDYKGDPGKLQAVIDRTYTRLHELVFEPVPFEEMKANDTDAQGDGNTEPLLGIGSLGKTYPYPWEAKIKAGYKRKKVIRTGKFRFDFRQRNTSVITTVMAGNIGNLFSEYGSNKSIFFTTNLSVDPAFLQRKISIALGAKNASEYKDFVRNVTVSLLKKHGSGEETLGEFVFHKKELSAGKGFSFSYPWDEETGHKQWRRYRYKVSWSFVGNVRHETDWLKSDLPALSLTPPYKFRRIEFLANPTVFSNKNVRMATVRLWYDFYGHKVEDIINLRASGTELAATREFAVPADKPEMEYEITWRLNDGSKISSGRMISDDTVIFCDEIPG